MAWTEVSKQVYQYPIETKRSLPLSFGLTCPNDHFFYSTAIYNARTFGSGKARKFQSLEEGPQYDRDAEIILLPTSVKNGLLILISGLACTYTLSNSKRRILAFHVPGDILNLSSLHGPNHAVAAVTECKLSYLPSQKLSGLVAHYPSIQEALVRQLGLEISILHKMDGVEDYT